MSQSRTIFSLFTLLLFSSLVSAEDIQLTFDGVINRDPNDSFTVVIEYNSNATDFTPDQDCCGKYGPMAIEFTHGDETLSILDANLNVDNIPHETFEGIQWVDDGHSWSGTLLGQSVQTLSINFGNEPESYTGLKTKDLPLTVDLDEWDYHNGTFVLANGDEGFFELNVQVFDSDGDGVNNNADSCADTSENAVVDATGCSIAQYCPADAFKNHGQRVSCTSRTSEDFVQTGLITEEEKGTIVSAAARDKSTGS